VGRVRGKNKDNVVKDCTEKMRKKGKAWKDSLKVGLGCGDTLVRVIGRRERGGETQASSVWKNPRLGEKNESVAKKKGAQRKGKIKGGGGCEKKQHPHH